jgi:CheY-like chemotaxis protein
MATPPLRVLLAASDCIIPLDMKRIVEQLGHRVWLARNAHVGFQIASTLTPSLALIDISSDRQGMIQLGKQLHDHGTPLVFVSSSLGVATAAQIRKSLPGVPVLQRPVSRRELAEAIQGATRLPPLLRNEDFEIILRFTREVPDVSPDLSSTIFDPDNAELLRLVLLKLDGDQK